MFLLILICYLSVLFWFRYKKHRQYSIAVILGSGGHTAEMLRILKHSESDYSNFTFWISEGDILSNAKIDKECKKVIVPRPRKVKEPLFRCLLRLPKCICSTIIKILHNWPSKIVCNGPGLCFVVACCAKLMRFFLIGSLPKVLVVYIESVARVKTLSLTGKLMRYVADRFIVQWPELLLHCPNHAECHLLV